MATMKTNRTNSNEIETSKLTKKEQLYWTMIKANALSGAVPFIKGRPGEAKTAILRSIAKKLGLQIIDLRLSQIDEVVVAGFPAVNKDGETFGFKLPEWAVKANMKPTLIIFEEYNRARLEQRNAAMEIMCERELHGFKFNNEVYMAATGNLGEEDGTEVEEIEAAQRGRLATIIHTLTIQDWEEGYAKENVHPLILNFVKNNPQYFYKYEDDADAYASPRAWDYLSKFIIANFGMDSKNTSEIKEMLMLVGKSYVGSSIAPLIRYLEQMEQLSINDILDRFNEVKDQVKNLSRAQISEYIANLDEIDIETLKAKQVNNLIKFIKTIDDDDEIMNLFIKMVKKLNFVECKMNPDKMKNTKKIIDTFPEIKKRLKENVKNS